MPAALLKVAAKYRMMISAFYRQDVRDKLDEGARYQQNSPCFNAQNFLGHVARIDMKGNDGRRK